MESIYLDKEILVMAVYCYQFFYLGLAVARRLTVARRPRNIKIKSSL